MKFKYLLFLQILFFHSCIKISTTETNDSKILGKWNFIQRKKISNGNIISTELFTQGSYISFDKAGLCTVYSASSPSMNFEKDIGNYYLLNDKLLIRDLNSNTLDTLTIKTLTNTNLFLEGNVYSNIQPVYLLQIECNR